MASELAKMGTSAEKLAGTQPSKRSVLCDAIPDCDRFICVGCSSGVVVMIGQLFCLVAITVFPALCAVVVIRNLASLCSNQDNLLK